MTPEERKKYLNTPVKVVVIRSFKGKFAKDAELKNYEVGEVITTTHEFADEAISLGKVVEEGKEAHKAWIESQKKKKASAPDQSKSLGEQLNELIDAVKGLTEVVSEALGKKK